MKKKFKIEGMTCSACQSHVQNGVSSLEGMQSCNVNLLTNSMECEFDDNICNADIIKNKVSSIGYKALLDDDKIKVNNNVKSISRLFFIKKTSKSKLHIRIYYIIKRY